MSAKPSLAILTLLLLAATLACDNDSGAPQLGDTYTETASGLDMWMVWIPGGSFRMGSPYSESGRLDREGPVRTVELDGFWMGATEVTQAQYKAVMGANPSNFTGANLPVEQVSWNDAMAFCQRLSERTGRTYTLPTEAQWEYACRAGTTTPFHFGATISSDQANYRGTSIYGSERKGVFRERTVPVGSFSPNVWGLYDMHGNVDEWCLDWYDENFYGKAAARARNPVNNNTGRYRVLRGGSWYYPPMFCRSARRNGDTPTVTNGVSGFRVVAVSSPGG